MDKYALITVVTSGYGKNRLNLSKEYWKLIKVRNKAKEVAKKLLKTGAIKAIKKSLEKEKAKDEKVCSCISLKKSLYNRFFQLLEYWWLQEVQRSREEVERDGQSTEQLPAVLGHSRPRRWL